MKVLILGGDGYLGWPTALYLSAREHEVTIVDNCVRRKICNDLHLVPLFPIVSMSQRVDFWQKHSGYQIRSVVGDVTDIDVLSSVVREFDPEAIIHFAEQPSAPYSMKGYPEARFTLVNNLLSTLNVANVVKECNPEIHILKLGTMGEYGTPNIDIEEGFIDIVHNGRSDHLLFPRQAGSLYHTTKIQDTDLLFFYVRNSSLRVTDLMQGPVYGFETPEIGNNVELSTFFNYDGVLGTVLNRFLVQAALSMPLSVYGQGGQKRGYLNLIDTLQCIELALKDPADSGEMRIFNQFTEIFSVVELAQIVVDAAKELGLIVTVKKIKNPRVELEDHYYNPSNKGLRTLGLKPNCLDTTVVTKMLEKIIVYKNNIDQSSIQPNIKW